MTLSDMTLPPPGEPVFQHDGPEEMKRCTDNADARAMEANHRNENSAAPNSGATGLSSGLKRF